LTAAGRNRNDIDRTMSYFSVSDEDARDFFDLFGDKI